jgi:hypothetical protein
LNRYRYQSRIQDSRASHDGVNLLSPWGWHGLELARSDPSGPTGTPPDEIGGKLAHDAQARRQCRNPIIGWGYRPFLAITGKYARNCGAAKCGQPEMRRNRVKMRPSAAATRNGSNERESPNGCVPREPSLPTVHAGKGISAKPTVPMRKSPEIRRFPLQFTGSCYTAACTVPAQAGEAGEPKAYRFDNIAGGADSPCRSPLSPTDIWPSAQNCETSHTLLHGCGEPRHHLSLGGWLHLSIKP